MLPVMRIPAAPLIAFLFVASAQASPLGTGDDMDRFLADKGLLLRFEQVR